MHRSKGTVSILISILSLFTFAQHLYEQRSNPPAPALPASVTDVTAEASFEGTLDHVIDGDTVVVERAGKKVTIRMIGINSPETGLGRRPVECFGREASTHLKGIIAPGASLRIETDPTQGTLDKYGRTLGYVFVGDTDLNLRMVADGFAHEYTYRTPYAHQSEYKAAETAARKAHAGLWADGACGTTNI